MVCVSRFLLLLAQLWSTLARPVIEPGWYTELDLRAVIRGENDRAQGISQAKSTKWCFFKSDIVQSGLLMQLEVSPGRCVGLYQGSWPGSSRNGAGALIGIDEWSCFHFRTNIKINRVSRVEQASGKENKWFNLQHFPFGHLLVVNNPGTDNSIHTRAQWALHSLYKRVGCRGHTMDEWFTLSTHSKNFWSD